jgi:hypothetical protein
MCTARLGHAAIKWLNYRELASQLKDLQFEFESTSACLLDGRLFFPLALVTEILLQAQPERNLPGWAKGILVSISSPMLPVCRPSSAAIGNTKLPSGWDEALRSAGHLAAHCMFMVQGGSALTPLVFGPDKQFNLVSCILDNKR